MEWIESDGLGGFAMGNACLWPTRRYHSLLTTARKAPTDRRVLLVGLEETVTQGNQTVRLDSSQRTTGSDPEGWRYQTGMEFLPYPQFRYLFAKQEISRSVLMPKGYNMVLIEYHHQNGSKPLDFSICPLLAGRSYHDLVQENLIANPDVVPLDHCMVFRSYEEEPSLYLCKQGWDFHPEPRWIRGVEYFREKQRGYPYQEDLLSPGKLTFTLQPGESKTLIFSSFDPIGVDVSTLKARELKRRAACLKAPPSSSSPETLLTLSADRFLVHRPPGKTILAGFPWFEDWSRDILLSLPGITRHLPLEDALNILETMANYLKGGLLPNRFGEEPDRRTYNAADASLLFVYELNRYKTRMGRWPSELLWEAALEVFEKYLAGTRHHIGVDLQDGLVRASEPGLPLTWMDAKVDDVVVTPRAGKPIELQGLWFSTCKTIEREALQRKNSELAERALAAAQKVKASISSLFWLRGPGYFADCLRDDGTLDVALRPNQLMTLAFTEHCIEPAHALQALVKIDKDLVTSFGLRTLAPHSPDYQPKYEGDVCARDHAYHQGTIWPWLLGPYAKACLAYRGDAERDRLRTLIQPLLEYQAGPGLGNIPEVFDAEPPHNPGGCPAQAWSTAQVIELLHQISESTPEPYSPVEH